jgi:Ala-tRNA(Pro) deacylase
MSSSPFDQPASDTVYERLTEKLRAAGATFTVQHHEPVFTSEAAAAARGTLLSSGAKALILNLDGNPALFILPADRKLDSRKLRTATSTRSLRFATPDEVLALTGLRPGSIPPFGSLFGLSTFCDPALAENPTINFNAGDHSISVSMPYADFLRVESPRLLEFSTAAAASA